MFYIEMVIVYNRTDGGWGKRLNNFYVLISENPFSSKTQQNVHSLFQGKADSVNTFKFNKTGRYVRIQLKNRNYLHSAEVEVMGF